MQTTPAYHHEPPTLERMNPHFWHGSAHAGAQSASQVGAMRPMLGWAQHHMPIPGWYQTGATTHPGGCVTGDPGGNAATVMLKDFGTSIEEVVNKKAQPHGRSKRDFLTRAAEWMRALPGVAWSHRRHLAAGVNCETSHGQVRQMDQMSEVTNVTSMAVCLNCREANHGKTVCSTCHKS